MMMILLIIRSNLLKVVFISEGDERTIMNINRGEWRDISHVMLSSDVDSTGQWVIEDHHWMTYQTINANKV